MKLLVIVSVLLVGYLLEVSLSKKVKKREAVETETVNKDKGAKEVKNNETKEKLSKDKIIAPNPTDAPPCVMPAKPKKAVPVVLDHIPTLRQCSGVEPTVLKLKAFKAPKNAAVGTHDATLCATNASTMIVDESFDYFRLEPVKAEDVFETLKTDCRIVAVAKDSEVLRKCEGGNK